MVAPLLVLALSACSNPSTAPLLVDSELGQPLADTRRSGETVLDRQSEPAPKPPVQHRVTNSARGHAPAVVKARNPLGDQPVQLNFVDADIQAVVRALSRATGQQFLVDPRVKGNLTLVSEGQVPAHQAYDMLLAALRMQGFSVVDVGGVAQVVPEADAKLLGGPIYTAGSSGMQTRTFRLQYENAVNLIPVLRPIVSPNNPINAYPGNNSIVITDYAENLARVAQIINGIDTPSAIDTDVVRVQNGIAVDIAAMVSELLETQGADQTQKINVIGDPRSNSIIIRSGSPERTELARNLIYKLDNAQSNPSNMHVVYLRNAQAGKLAQSLRGLLTGESDSGVSDDARGKLSAMGGNGKNTEGTSNAQNSSGTPTGSGVQSGYGQSTGSTTGTSGTSQDQDTSFSAGGVTIQADATTNTLLISAPDPLYRNLREVIDMLDQRRAQVVIESLIVEVGEDDATEFGVQWQAGNLGGKGGFGGVNLGGSGVNSTPTSKTSIDVLPKGLNVGLVDGTVDIPGIGKVLDLKVLARALKSKGGTNVLSTPNLLTLDNEAASIFVGQTIPFVTGSYVTGGGGTSNNPFQTVQREEVGLKLNVRPQISEGGTVKLDIYQEVSTVDERASVTAGTVTNKRAIDTSILLDDGQIMVLGGLLQDGYSQSNDAVPWLSDIPGLGALFRNEKRSVSKTNLMVFLRPYIIRDSGAGRSITLNRYEFMRRAQGALQPEHSWAMPDVQAPQLPSVEKAIPGQQGPRAVIRAVPQ
ncbi:general secretion pathway protein D [Pseudomonas simiae]|jgi:general secretion pathway protein D|uniref:General secretion pathway protein D n=2 Tax=Pseudomonas simiae TaxID=321846 RepID=U1SN61_9PSED|nr:general secretion pathway protein D [Pseudomonas simiae]